MAGAASVAGRDRHRDRDKTQELSIELRRTASIMMSAALGAREYYKEMFEKNHVPFHSHRTANILKASQLISRDVLNNEASSSPIHRCASESLSNL